MEELESLGNGDIGQNSGIEKETFKGKTLNQLWYESRKGYYQNYYERNREKIKTRISDRRKNYTPEQKAAELAQRRVRSRQRKQTSMGITL